MAAIVLVGILTYDNIMLAPVFALAGTAVFLGLTWMFQAEAFLGALDKTLPFDLPGPLRRLVRRR